MLKARPCVLSPELQQRCPGVGQENSSRALYLNFLKPLPPAQKDMVLLPTLQSCFGKYKRKEGIRSSIDLKDTGIPFLVKLNGPLLPSTMLIEEIQYRN